MLMFSAYINSFMALFNLIPFGVLDGYKIFSINKLVWVLAFIPSVALTVIIISISKKEIKKSFTLLLCYSSLCQP